MSASFYRIQGALDALNDPNSQLFAINTVIKRIAGATLVSVVSCTNNGAVAGIGQVNVQPLVSQINGNGQPTPHGIVNNLLYCRSQAGQNAIINDPQPDDIGVAIFCSRDISSVRTAAAQSIANGTACQPQTPSSYRFWNWADGIYLWSVLSGAPTQQYIQFLNNAINIYSATQILLQSQLITLTAPQITVNASMGFTVNSPQTALSGALSVADDAVIGGIGFLEHIHGGVETGGSTTAPPQA